MKLKHLHLQGFKTFARRTEFSFGDGITAVIGPNGSGKSNVADAIRWVLGEQSFSLIRSKRTEDVIFAGSDQRARLGLAEATLTLDNSDGRLPIDFTEVTITRRAHRSGDNEYLLNSAPVRLRDITELLAASGLGRRTYAVIGQGLIDQALSLKPEERRSLIEEAAGITGYQMKRATTLQRLEATEANLMRVRDIITEITPRLSTLARQAERAQERTRVEEDLRAVLRTWYGYRWHKALDDLAQAQRGESAARAAAEKRQQALEAAEAEAAQLRQRLTELRAQLGAWHREASDLHRTAEHTQRELAVSTERRRLLDRRREELRDELEPLHDRIAEQAEHVASVEQKLEALEEEVAQAQTAVKVAQAELDAWQQSRRDAEAHVASLREKVYSLSSDLAERQNRLQRLVERRAALADEQEQRQELQAATQAEMEAAEAEWQQWQKQTADLRQRIEGLQADQSTADAMLLKARETLQELYQERMRLERRLEGVRERFDLLSRLREEGAGYNAGVRTLLSALEQKRLRLGGVIGAVPSLLRVPPRLDVAIETALGGSMHDVVVRRWDVAEEAIAWLKQTGSGRATFLPLDTIRPWRPLRPPSLPGILGLASELVGYKSELQPVVESLLGRTWVVDSLPAARRAFDSASGGPRPTIVTVEGDILRPGGSVSGGSERNQGQARGSVLAREREWRDLPSQIETLEWELEQTFLASEEQKKIEQRVQKKASAATTELEQLAAELTRVEAAQVEARRALDRAQQESTWQGSLLERNQEESAELIQLENKLQEEVAALEQELATVREGLAEAQSRLQQLDQDARNDELSDLRAQLAMVTGRRETQLALLQQARQEAANLAEEVRSKEERLAALAQERAALEEKIAELRSQAEALGGQLEVKQNEIEPAEQELSELETRQLQQEDVLQTARQNLRHDEAGWNSAQLTLQRCQDEIAHLRREIEQDFGLVALEESDALADQPPLPLEALVEKLPVVRELPEGVESEVKRLRQLLSRLARVNPEAPAEYQAARERHQFLTGQAEDLEQAAASLRAVIDELDELMEREFDRTFQAVATEFENFFTILFGGGGAKLSLTDPDDLTNTGLEIIARPPSKRAQSLALLSGGERALTACALIFAILKVSPTPFCIMDEVDAALDEANVGRFRDALLKLAEDTQFIVITHNHMTLEAADAIYGVTLGRDGVSQVVSVKLDGHVNGTLNKEELETFSVN